jgi:predicted flap endonuclease-1-like 5' DNA nuclease
VFWETFGTKVPVATAGQKDDLVGGIKGIGPKTGQRLNELGVFTFAQLAAFDGEIIAKISELVGALPGKIEREDWVGQAKKKLAAKA